MEFLIADTFGESLARLSGDEQKAVKTTAFDLQINPASPGMSFHRVDRAKDKNFWSVRASGDIRLIVHKTAASMLLCYVDHHDKAYAWAERRKLEVHPTTGAAQMVEIRETVKEIIVPNYVQEQRPTAKATHARPSAILAWVSDEELLRYGVPPEWLMDVKNADEDQLLEVSAHLPAEAAEAILELATGGKPRWPDAAAIGISPFDHPDAQRRFRVMTNVDELRRALDFPWEKWTVFLHPEQRHLVEEEFSGPARVSGSAGTGKTIVALHRAAFLARKHPDSRVLLTTFSEPLANQLGSKLRVLLSSEPRLMERIDVDWLENAGLRLYRAQVGPAKLVSRDKVREVLRSASEAVAGHRFTAHFLMAEWEQIVDAWQLSTWDGYRDAVRLGRKTRLTEAQRQVLWEVFERVAKELELRRLLTPAQVFTSLAKVMSSGRRPYDFAVVDEAQDIGVAHLRFLAALGQGRPDALFFTGDLGQRIFQQPFSWKSLGVDIRGRSRTLRVNYRTSHQIRSQADRLLGPALNDVDGNVESRKDTVSVFNGPPPVIRSFGSEAQEIDAVAAWLAECQRAHLNPHEIALFVRSDKQLGRAAAAAKKAGIAFKILDERVDVTTGHVAISTMHIAKGLEFRAVAVMACDDEIVPLQERIETVGDDADLREVYDTERHLLYVAATRARDHLLVTSVEPASEFLDDMTRGTASVSDVG